MKKLLCIILVLLMLFATACATSSKSVESSVAESSDGENIIFSYPTESSTEPSSAESTEASSQSSENSINSGADATEDSPSSSTSEVPSSSETDSSTNQNQDPVISAPPISSPDISIAPSNPENTWINDLKGQQDTDYHGYTAEQLDDYFDDALFVGDSVSNGLKLYTSMYEKGIFSGMTFHTGACYGFNNCLSAVTNKSLHPVYQGQQRTIWEMISLTNPNKVFIGFGLNDFGCVTTNNIKKCLDKIIANIRAVKPDIQIILLSSGYFTKAGEKYNPSMNDFRVCSRQRDYNQFVLEYCNSLGLDYIDVSNCFADEYGYLDKDLAMDNYCHPHIKHYHMWRDILYGYAADKINGNYTNPERMR